MLDVCTDEEDAVRNQKYAKVGSLGGGGDNSNNVHLNFDIPEHERESHHTMVEKPSKRRLLTATAEAKEVHTLQFRNVM